jgi:hypothetical protein
MSSLSHFNGLRTLLVIVRHVVDPRAHGVALHEPGIVGLQGLGDRGGAAFLAYCLRSRRWIPSEVDFEIWGIRVLTALCL